MTGRETEAQGCWHPAFLARLIFLSISVSSGEAEEAGVPKMCFRPMLKKEASLFTAETAFLLTWVLLGRSSVGALRKVDFLCQVSCQAFSPERCKTAEVEVGNDTELDVCVCKISWHIHLGAQGVRWLQISARSQRRSGVRSGTGGRLEAGNERGASSPWDSRRVWVLRLWVQGHL